LKKNGIANFRVFPLCAVFLFIIFVDCAFSDSASNLKPLEKPVRLVLSAHGSGGFTSSAIESMAQITIRLITKELEGLEPERPIWIWYESANPPVLSAFRTNLSQTVHTLSNRYNLSPDVVLDAVYKNSHEAATNTESQRIIADLKMLHEIATAEFDREFQTSTFETVCASLYISKINQFIQNLENHRKISYRMEQAPFDAFLMQLRTIPYESFYLRQALESADKKSVLKYAKLGLVTSNDAYFLRDRKLALDIQAEVKRNPEVAHIVLRGPIHFKLSEELSSLGIGNIVSIDENELVNLGVEGVLLRDFDELSENPLPLMQAAIKLTTGYLSADLDLNQYNILEKSILALNEKDVDQWWNSIVEKRAKMDQLAAATWEWLKPRFDSA